MQDNGWDRALKVTAGGKGQVGHAGAILLRKAADATGLTSLLSGALAERDTVLRWCDRSPSHWSLIISATGRGGWAGRPPSTLGSPLRGKMPREGRSVAALLRRASRRIPPST